MLGLMLVGALAVTLVSTTTPGQAPPAPDDVNYVFCATHDVVHMKAYYSAIFVGDPEITYEQEYADYMARTYNFSGQPLCFANGDDYEVKNEIRTVQFSDQLKNYTLVITNWQPAVSPN